MRHRHRRRAKNFFATLARKKTRKSFFLFFFCFSQRDFLPPPPNKPAKLAKLAKLAKISCTDDKKVKFAETFVHNTTHSCKQKQTTCNQPMSLVSLANVCAHLQNVSRAGSPLASIPYTRLHLQIALGLYKEGFISTLQRGSQNGPDLTPVDVTPDNISTRRLWLGMKYRNGNPVLSKFQLISKPNRKVYATSDELRNFATGKRFRFVKPIMPGEIVFVKPKNSKEVINLHEAVKKQIDGELLCRVY